MADLGGSDIRSVARAFEVLELFEDVRAPMTSIAVGRRLNYPASSALALLKTMVKLGYLSFDRIDRTYFPSLRLTLLGQWVESTLHHGQGALATVADVLTQATGESMSLSCQSDLDMQFIYVTHGPQHITVNITPGVLAPLFQSAIGLAALSGRADAEITRLVQRYNRLNKAKTSRVKLEDILKIVDGIRRRGWFAGYDMYTPGVGAISWLLPARDGGRAMVLAVSGPTERIRQNEARITRIVPPILEDYGVIGQDRPRRAG